MNLKFRWVHRNRIRRTNTLLSKCVDAQLVDQVRFAILDMQIVHHSAPAQRIPHTTIRFQNVSIAAIQAWSDRDLLDFMERIDAAGAGFRSLIEAIDTTTPAGRMMMQMIGSFAEFERAMIRERRSAGLA